MPLHFSFEIYGHGRKWCVRDMGERAWQSGWNNRTRITRGWPLLCIPLPYTEAQSSSETCHTQTQAKHKVGRRLNSSGYRGAKRRVPVKWGQRLMVTSHYVPEGHCSDWFIDGHLLWLREESLTIHAHSVPVVVSNCICLRQPFSGLEEAMTKRHRQGALTADSANSSLICGCGDIHTWHITVGRAELAVSFQLETVYFLRTCRSPSNVACPSYPKILTLHKLPSQLPFTWTVVVT